MDKQIENNSLRRIVLIEIRITAAKRHTNYPSLISRFIGFLCNNSTIPCENETFICTWKCFKCWWNSSFWWSWNVLILHLKLRAQLRSVWKPFLRNPYLYFDHTKNFITKCSISYGMVELQNHSLLNIQLNDITLTNWCCIEFGFHFLKNNQNNMFVS